MVGSVHRTSAFVGSARTRLMAETLPLRKTHYFCFSLVWLPSHACGYFDVQRPWGIVRRCGRTETKWDDGTQPKSHETVTRALFCDSASHVGSIIGGTERRFRRGHCSLSLSLSFSFFFSASLLRLPVNMCQTCKRCVCVCVSKYVQESSAKPYSCW